MQVSTADKSAWPADAVERRAVASLVPYARNARTHSPEQVAQIAASIREWGWTNPVLIDESGSIIAGHGRVLAAQKLGIGDVPVMVARGWTEAQRRAYVLADNKLALNAGWDAEMLRLEFGELQDEGFDLGLAGFSPDELQTMFGELADPAATPDDGGNYSEQYGVIVMCSSAATQEDTYNRLRELGYECKVVTT